MKIVDRYNLVPTVKSLTMGNWYEVAVPPFTKRKKPPLLRMLAFQKPDRKGSVVMKNEQGGHITVKMNQIVGEASNFPDRGPMKRPKCVTCPTCSAPAVEMKGFKHVDTLEPLKDLVRCIRDFQLGDFSPLMDEIFDAEHAIRMAEGKKLLRGIDYGY